MCLAELLVPLNTIERDTDDLTDDLFTISSVFVGVLPNLQQNLITARLSC
jgi:hypothetical protein